MQFHGVIFIWPGNYLDIFIFNDNQFFSGHTHGFKLLGDGGNVLIQNIKLERISYIRL